MSCLQVLPFPSQVLYNRVGKCGSRTVVILLRLLAEKHQFNLVSSDIHNKTRLSKHEQVRVTWPLSHALTVPGVVTCTCRRAAEGRGVGGCCSFHGQLETQSHGGALCLQSHGGALCLQELLQSHGGVFCWKALVFTPTLLRTRTFDQLHVTLEFPADRCLQQVQMWGEEQENGDDQMNISAGASGACVVN